MATKRRNRKPRGLSPQAKASIPKKLIAAGELTGMAVAANEIRKRVAPRRPRGPRGDCLQAQLLNGHLPDDLSTEERAYYIEAEYLDEDGNVIT